MHDTAGSEICFELALWELNRAKFHMSPVTDPVLSDSDPPPLLVATNAVHYEWADG